MVRTDQPPGADVPALPELSGEREVLRRRLERLPPGHPSSPVQELRGDASRQSADSSPGDSQDARSAERADWRPLTDAEHAEHVSEVRELLDKARAEGLATELQHTTDADHEQWTEERAIMHDAIIAHLYWEARGAPCEHRAILAGGLPGAGKTTVLEQHAGIDRSQYLTINPDDIKEEMATRGMIPEVAGLTPMEASELAHEESSHIAKQLALRAMPDGKNVIWDITMSSRDSTEKRLDDLRNFGYKHVDAIFVDIPVDTSIRRVDARHRDDHDSHCAGRSLGGRFIASEIINFQKDPDWGSRNRRTFEQIKPQLDAWKQYDNSVDGRAPLLVDFKGRDEGKV